MRLKSNSLTAAMRMFAVATLTIAAPVFAQEGPLTPTEPAPTTQSTATPPQSAQPATAPAPAAKPVAATPPTTTPPAQSASTPTPQLASPPPSQAAVIHRGLTKSALALANVNLRSGPGTDTAIVTTIPGGSTVHVAGCQGEWCAVTWNGRRGFAVASSLATGGARQARQRPARRAYVASAEDDAPVVYAAPGYYPPPPVVYGPGYYRYYGPRYYYRRGWWGRW